MRRNQISFLCSFLLVLAGCHNNAHLRTQKVLKPGEKAYSGSGVVALGGAEENWERISNTGVMGLRGEISMLKGSKDSEAGPYFGLGIGDGGPGLILGYDYRKYTGQGTSSPKKMGAQFEVNIGEAGSTLHLRPSLTSTTKRGRPFYGGLHGLLAVGSLKENLHWEWRTSDSSANYSQWHSSENEVDYRFNSLGAGLTAGAEFLTFDNSSIQLQVDVSLVKNSFDADTEPISVDMENVTWASWLDYNGNIDEEWEGQKDYVMPMVTGSLGMSFFKPDPTNKQPFEPLPAPAYGAGMTQPVFDPETGKKTSGAAIRFDPETGEAITEIQFDPETGVRTLPTAEKQKMPYDEVILQAKKAARSRHNRGLYNAAGVASCFIYPVGLPVAILYTESGVASNMNLYDPVYLDLGPSQKNQYKYAYKQEEKNLRRKSIYGAEGFCVGLFFFAIVSDGM